MAQPAAASAAAFASTPRSGMPDASSPRPSDFPAWALLDTVAQIGRCDNETTAETETSAHRPIKVSFVVVDPPGVSRCVVHCPHLTAGSWKKLPLVTGAGGAFLLLRVVFPERDGRGMLTDLFVYRAGPTPKLYLLPRPYPVNLPFNYAGVLPCPDCPSEHSFIVIPELRLEAGLMSYDLYVFSTKTESWSTKVARVASDLRVRCEQLVLHEPSKVLSMGGGRLAWVDLREGILLCDVLAKEPEMRLIQLPPLTPTNNVRFGLGSDGTRPPLHSIRDVNCKSDLIRFVEIEYPSLSDSLPIDFRWTATISMKPIDSGIWEECCSVESANLLLTEMCFQDLCPEIWDYKDGKLNNVVCTAPMLDAYDENILYMVSKLDARNPNGWMLSIDAGQRKLKKAVAFSAERFYFKHEIMPCAFSKYLGKAPGTHFAQLQGSCTCREKNSTVRENVMMLETYLLSALDQLRNIEIHITSDGSMPFCSGPASSLDAYIQKISAPIDAVKSNVSIAHCTLCKLLQTLPSDVHDEKYATPKTQ